MVIKLEMQRLFNASVRAFDEQLIWISGVQGTKAAGSGFAVLDAP